MTPKNELNIAYGMVVILLVLGILSYTAFSAKSPDEPNRIMFQSTAGKVLFTHQTHASEVEYGVACRTCHHHLEEDDDGHVLIIDRDLDFNVITEIMGWTWEKDLLHWKRKTNYDEDGMPILDTLTLPDMTKGDKGE